MRQPSHGAPASCGSLTVPHPSRASPTSSTRPEYTPRAVIPADPEGLLQIVRPDGSYDEALDPGLPVETLHAMHHFMTLQRTLDKRMMLLQRQGRFGFYGEIRGQEATPTAFGHALRPTDPVFQGLRESLIMLIRGFPLDRFVAQVFGNALDELKGRQMPSHYASRSVHQVSWSS